MRILPEDFSARLSYPRAPVRGGSVRRPAGPPEPEEDDMAEYLLSVHHDYDTEFLFGLDLMLEGIKTKIGAR